MSASLYDPQRGYYARETRQVGRAGDFFTSVSVGPVFGRLLAERFVQWWDSNGNPAQWRIIELGAHDGRLAADVLAFMEQLHPAAFAGLEYVIIEPLPGLAAAQRDRLSPFCGRLVIRQQVDSLPPRPGIAFGNELLDALPFHVIEWHDGRWTECHVGHSGAGFCWLPGQPLHPGLASLPGDLPGPFPEGYRSEIRSCYPGLLESLADALGEGLILWIDYGFARPEYYSESRTTGTLRTYHRHQAGEDPLADPGGADITAHVDFTHVAETALSLGMTPSCFCDQGSWLTRLAGPWLRSMESEPDAAAIRQFQTLVHPAHLGARFHVLELSLCCRVDPAEAARVRQRLALSVEIHP